MKHLFIVGCPRSGTTWTLMLLARHPRAVAAQHVAFFHSLKHLEEWFTDHEVQSKKRWGKSVVVVDDAKEGAPAADKGAVTMDGIMTERQFYDLCRHTADELFSGVLRHKPDAELLIEKTPENLRVADFILKVYPDAHFLHIVRDPRSVYASLKSAVGSFEQSSVFPGNPMAGARFWLDDFEQGRRIESLTKNYLEIRYETLLASGAPELERVFAWLGVEADRAFCEKTVEAASLKNLQKMPNAPKAFFRKGEAEGWREELTEEEIRILEFMLKDTMAELGYERAYPDARRPMKLVVEEGVQKSFNRLQLFTVRAMRKFGYVIPKTALERKTNKERRAAREAKKAKEASGKDKP